MSSGFIEGKDGWDATHAGSNNGPTDLDISGVLRNVCPACVLLAMAFCISAHILQVKEFLLTDCLIVCMFSAQRAITFVCIFCKRGLE